MQWKKLQAVTSSIEFNKDVDDREKVISSLGAPENSNEPRGRSSHSLSAAKLSNGRSVLVLFGGEDLPRHTFENCVWIMDLTDHKWNRLETTGEIPSSRLGHVAEIIVDNLWIFGGRNNNKEELNDLYSLNLISGIWKKINAGGDLPQGRSYHSSDISGSNLIIFSGCGVQESGKSCRLNDLFMLDTSSLVWTKKGTSSTLVPLVRGGSNIVAKGTKAYVFGGFSGKQLDDFWSFNFETDQWSLLDEKAEVIPEARSVACGLRLGNNFFVFGGEKEASASGHEGAGLYLNNSFIYDFTGGMWTQVKSDLAPSPRGWFSAAALDDKIYVFGGFDGKGRINDLWKLE